MEISGCVSLVMGAARGIGRALCERLRARAAAKVYVTDRDMGALVAAAAADPDRFVAFALDVTDPSAVAAAADRARDVTLLVNNAGVLSMGGFLSAATLDAARREVETNYFGPLAMIRAFAPVLAANGGGTVVNVLSIAARVNMPFIASYSASKAAAWSLTQGVRAELAGQGTTVIGVFPGPVDTDMAAGLTVDKARPEAVADAILDAVAQGVEDVYPDSAAQAIAAALAADAKAVERTFAGKAGAGRN